MAKLNATKVTEKVFNHEGARAYKHTEEYELYTLASTCLWQEPKFYGNTGDTEKRIIELCRTLDPEFVVKLAVYIREKMYLRTVPQVMLVEVANRADLKGKDKPWLKTYGARIMSRADEVLEALSYQVKNFGKGIPSGLRKAMAERLNGLTQYEVMKYDSNKREMKYCDALNLIHPVSAENDALFEYITTGTYNGDVLRKIAAFDKLKAITEFGPEAIDLAKQCDATWEFMVSKFGNKPEVWEAAKLPYMATLRNLRNLNECGIVDKYLPFITDPESIRRSKQLPYRFYSAYCELKDAGAPMRVLAALEQALSISVENVPNLPGKTAVLIDASGSMEAPLSDKSSVSRMAAGAVLGSIAQERLRGYVIGFGAYAGMAPAGVGLFGLVDWLPRANLEYATIPSAAIELMMQRDIDVDRIILVSDMQCYTLLASGLGDFRSMLKKYREKQGKPVKLVSIDIAGYGTAVVPQNDPDTMTCAGFSDRVFDMIRAWEMGEDGLKTAIGNI